MPLDDNIIFIIILVISVVAFLQWNKISAQRQRLDSFCLAVCVCLGFASRRQSNDDALIIYLFYLLPYLIYLQLLGWPLLSVLRYIYASFQQSLFSHHWLILWQVLVPFLSLLAQTCSHSIGAVQFYMPLHELLIIIIASLDLIVVVVVFVVIVIIAAIKITILIIL